MRNTKQKSMIIKILEGGGHISALEIYNNIITTTKIDISTVYRNLNIMVQRREIEKIIDKDGIARYHINSYHHGHLICMKCNNITEIPCSICSQLHSISQKSSFDDVEHEINIYGYCKTCKGGK